MFITLAIIIFTIYISYIYLDKLGLKLSLALFTVISFFMSFKITNFIGIDINFNIIINSAIFIIIYILIEKCNTKEIKETIKFLILTELFIITSFFIFVSYIQNINDHNAINIQKLVNILPYLSYYIILPVSFIFNLNLYKYLNKINNNKSVNIVICTVVISLIEIFTQSICSYFLLLEMSQIINLAIASYLFRIIIIIISLPFINYISKKKVIL